MYEDESVARDVKNVCFVISPFGRWFDDYYIHIFCPAIEAANLQPKRADSLFTSSNIVHDIWHLVTTSRVVLADLTDRNPNVYYELGLAHAARKPVLLLAQKIEEVPFDLRALRVITYDTHDPRWAQKLRNRIQDGLTQTISSPERFVLPTFLLEGPGEGPTLDPSEIAVLDLQQQINSLNAQVASMATLSQVTHGVSDSVMTDSELGDAITALVRQGNSAAAIERMLSTVRSKDWIRGELRRRRFADDARRASEP